MNFKVFKCYIYVCNSIGVKPTWEGLERFRVFCLRESGNGARY